MLETITLAGTKFTRMQAFAANQDDYIIGHLRLAGAVGVLHDLDGVKRTEEQRAEDLLTRILLSGKTHHVLAGCLTEDGKVWSRAEAEANARRFAAITDTAEKLAMGKFIVEFVIGFCSAREASEFSGQVAEVRPARNAALVM